MGEAKYIGLTRLTCTLPATLGASFHIVIFKLHLPRVRTSPDVFLSFLIFNYNNYELLHNSILYCPNLNTSVFGAIWFNENFTGHTKIGKAPEISLPKIISGMRINWSEHLIINKVKSRCLDVCTSSISPIH